MQPSSHRTRLHHDLGRCPIDILLEPRPRHVCCLLYAGPPGGYSSFFLAISGLSILIFAIENDALDQLNCVVGGMGQKRVSIAWVAE